MVPARYVMLREVVRHGNYCFRSIHVPVHTKTDVLVDSFAVDLPITSYQSQRIKLLFAVRPRLNQCVLGKPVTSLSRLYCEGLLASCIGLLISACSAWISVVQHLSIIFTAVGSAVLGLVAICIGVLVFAG